MTHHEIALGIVVSDEQVLIVERGTAESGPDGQILRWAFPGGKVEHGETPFQAAEREVREETGVHVAAEALIHQGEHPAFPAYVSYIGCRAVDGTSLESDDPAIAAARWVPVGELDSYFTSALNPHVHQYLAETTNRERNTNT